MLPRLGERRRVEVGRRHVAAEDRVVLRELEVDLADRLLLVDVARVGDADAAAGVGRSSAARARSRTAAGLSSAGSIRLSDERRAAA